MAYQTRISAVLSNAACDAMVDLCDAGGAGYVEIRSGTQPADPDTAASGSEIATITLNTTAFGAASDGVATANESPALTDSSATGGTATWFRVYNNAGTALWDGACGTSASDMNLDNTTIGAGQSVTITSWTFTMEQLEA